MKSFYHDNLLVIVVESDDDEIIVVDNAASAGDRMLPEAALYRITNLSNHTFDLVHPGTDTGAKGVIPGATRDFVITHRAELKRKEQNTGESSTVVIEFLRFFAA